MREVIRSVFTLCVFLAAVIGCGATPVHAQNLPWCAIMDNDGNTQCNYSTFQQCLQTLSGIGGRCIENPAGSVPQLAPTSPSSENAQGLLPLQLQSPGPPPGLGGPAVPAPPNN